MPLIDMLFNIFLGLSFGMVIALIFIGIMHFLMPKSVLDKYFKPPYFKAGECELFTGIPYGWMRTVMFMRGLGFPDSGKKRGISEAYKLAPRWYVILSRIIVIYILGTTISFFFVVFVFVIIAMCYTK